MRHNFFLIAIGVIILHSSCKLGRQDSASDSHKLIPANPESVGMSSQRLKRINAVVQKYVDSLWISGATGFIARHGKIVYHQSFGKRDIEQNDPMQNENIYRIASMSKAITTVAVMMLYEEGYFLLDDPLYYFIPEFKDPVILDHVNMEDSTFTSHPAKKQITIRQLLTHTTGIGYSFSHENLRPLYQKAGIPDGLNITNAILGDKMKALARMPLLHEPGEKFTYGLNTDVLGYLIEVISGKSLYVFLKERIFQPLEMESTHFYLFAKDETRLVTLYEPDSMGGLRPSTVMDYYYPVEGNKSYYSGGAGLLSTAFDYGKFLQMLVNNGYYNGHQLLSRKTVEIITKNQVGDLWKGNHFGLGFGITTEESSASVLSSPGNYWWGGYFSTSYWIDPSEGLVAVFMTQMFPNNHGEIHKKFQVLTYQAIVD
jgi:CubicO group peptidase (beta-lactamase class C family)